MTTQLSRLDQTKGGRDVKYLAEYWVEHANNFRDFLLRMLESKTIAKLASNANDLCCRITLHLHLATPEYTNKIKAAYERFEANMNGVRDAKMAVAQKNQLCEDMDSYFTFLVLHLDPAKNDSIMGLPALFGKHVGSLESVGKKFSGK